jgi:hypothetical protein
MKIRGRSDLLINNFLAAELPQGDMRLKLLG